MPSFSTACRQLVNKKFKEIVGPVAKENGFKFKNYYTYYRVKNDIIQSFALKNCRAGWFEIFFAVSPTSIIAPDSGSVNRITYFNKDNKYHISLVGSWEYKDDQEKITTYMNEVKEMVEERLIPFFDSLTDDRALLDFFKEPVNPNYRAIRNIYLKLEEYGEAENLIRSRIERIISDLYEDIHGLSKYPREHSGKNYMLFFKELAGEAQMLQYLEEENYDYFREMIRENVKKTEEFLKNPKFYRF